MAMAKWIILGAITLVVLAAGSSAFVRAQDKPKDDITSFGEIDFVNFRNRSEFTLASPDLLPRQIARQLSDCDYKTRFSQFPVRFIEPKPRQRFALVFCSAISGSSHQVFDLASDKWRRAPVVFFPVLAPARGFTTSEFPGFIEWDKANGFFTATRSSDMCENPLLRHTYQFGPASGGYFVAPFVLIRVEGTNPGVGCLNRSGPWITVWESSQWPAFTVIR